MSVPLLIAIDPQKQVNKNIIELRKYITKATGINFYGNHDPHITLVVNSFRNFSEVDRKVKEILKTYKPFYAKIRGLGVLSNPFPNHVILYKIKKDKILSNLQKQLTEKLNTLRTQDQANWMLKQENNFKQKNLKNLEKWGYPFGPKEFMPHASIGTIRKDQYKAFYEKVWKKSKQSDLKTKWKVNWIGIYVLLGEDGWTLYKRYKL